MEWIARDRRSISAASSRPSAVAWDAGAAEIVAQSVEFLAHAGGHLLAHVLAQRLQFVRQAGKRARACDLLPRALDLAAYRSDRVGTFGATARGRRAVGRPRLRAGLTLRARCGRRHDVGEAPGATILVFGGDTPLLHAAKAGLEILERAIEILEGGMRPTLPAGIQGVEKGPVAVHRKACS
ncbi:hypothetical protein [Aquibium microcysteis]|uniref:hypothetical protein n=1 Tax=Aquibium microcysteis TaxID=675281 RepID=UPI0030844E4D